MSADRKVRGLLLEFLEPRRRRYEHTTDVCVRDRGTGTTTRVSVGSGRTQATGSSFAPAMSPDGRFVAFISDAADLVSGDTDHAQDVFVHDRMTDETTRVSLSASGQESVRMELESLHQRGRPLRRLLVGLTEPRAERHQQRGGRVRARSSEQHHVPVQCLGGGREGNRTSLDPTISGDGRYVAYESLATNLVDDDTNGPRTCFSVTRVAGDDLASERRGGRR